MKIAAFTALFGAILLHGGGWFASQVEAVVPVTGPLESTCGGQTATPGGMFGQSIAMTDGSVGTTTMVVAKPWDGTVHVYSAATPNRTYTSSNVPNAVGAPSWQPMGYVNDTLQSLYPWTMLIDPLQGGPSYSKSYFGYSVDITKSGSLMAVGVPGRYGLSMNYPNATTPQLDWAPFTGEVRFYIMPSAGTNVTGLSFTALAPPAPYNSGYKLKFGHQVKFSLDGKYLFVASNYGWDGVWIAMNYTSTGPNPGCRSTTFGSNSRNMNYAGVFVYTISGTTPSFQTFLPLVSSVPFGQSGPRIETTGYGAKTILTVRSYGRDATGVSTSGGVSVYALSGSTFVLQNTIYNRPITTAANTTSYQSEDWFGYGIGLGYDNANDRLMMGVGAPRDGSQAYVLAANNASLTYNTPLANLSTTTGWSSLNFGFGYNVTNDAYVQRNFFGGHVVLSSDARFMYVGDATNTNGRGQVQVYMLRRGSTAGSLVALGYESVAISPVPTGYTNATISSVSYIYDKITTLAGNLTDYAIGQQTSLSAISFKQDNFGKSIATNPYWTIISAPAGSCVYTFPSLISYVPPPASADTGSSSNVTPPSNADSSNGRNAIYIGIGTALGVALFAIPGAFWALRNQHKKKLIAQLEAQKALAELNANPWENSAFQGGADAGAAPDASAGNLIG